MNYKKLKNTKDKMDKSQNKFILAIKYSVISIIFLIFEKYLLGTKLTTKKIVIYFISALITNYIYLYI